MYSGRQLKQPSYVMHCSTNFSFVIDIVEIFMKFDTVGSDTMYTSNNTLGSPDNRISDQNWPL